MHIPVGPQCGRTHRRAGGGMEIMLLLSGREGRADFWRTQCAGNEMDGVLWMGRQEEDTGKAEEVIVILDAPSARSTL